jgi:hypothetical protein
LFFTTPGGVDGKKQKVSGKVFCFSLKKKELTRNSRQRKRRESCFFCRFGLEGKKMEMSH